MTDTIPGLPKATLLDWTKSNSSYDSGTKHAKIVVEGNKHRVGTGAPIADLAQAIEAAEVLWMVKAPIEQLRLRLVALGGKRPSFRWIEDENGWLGLDGSWSIYAARPEGIAGKVAGVIGKIPLPFLKNLPAVIDPDYAKTAAERSWLIARLYQVLAATQVAADAAFVDHVFAPPKNKDETTPVAKVVPPEAVASVEPKAVEAPKTAAAEKAAEPAPVPVQEAPAAAEIEAAPAKPARRRAASKVAAAAGAVPVVDGDAVAAPPATAPAKRGRPAKDDAKSTKPKEPAAAETAATPEKPAALPKTRKPKADAAAAPSAPKAPRAQRKPKPAADSN